MSQEEKIIESVQEVEFDKEEEALDCDNRQLEEEKVSRKKWSIALMGLALMLLLIAGSYILR